MHKTGSSAIQETLRRNTALLEARDICFPDFGQRWGGANHSLLAFLALARKGDWIAQKYLGKRALAQLPAIKARAAETLAETLQKPARGTLIISGEEISRIGEFGVSRLAEMLYRDFDRVQVVAYVRPPADWISSMVCGQVKRGRSLSTIYARQNLDHGYRRRLQPFVDIFGRDFTVVRYQRQRLHRQCVVADFLRVAGFDDDLYDALDKSRIKANAGLSAAAVQRLDRLNTWMERLRFHPSLAQAVARLAASRPGSAKPGYRLPAEVERLLLPGMEADWRWIESLVDAAEAESRAESG